MEAAEDVEAVEEAAADRELDRHCPAVSKMSGACCWLALLAAVLAAVAMIAFAAWAAGSHAD